MTPQLHKLLADLEREPRPPRYADEPSVCNRCGAYHTAIGRLCYACQGQAELAMLTVFRIGGQNIGRGLAMVGAYEQGKRDSAPLHRTTAEAYAAGYDDGYAAGYGPGSPPPCPLS